MPTVLVLDCSLSMKCPVDSKTCKTSHLDLAVEGLTWLLDYLAEKFPLEYTAILTCSSVCKNLVSFSRDYQKLKSKLEGVAVHDKTDLMLAISNAIQTVVGEWGTFTPCQIVMVTDGKPGRTPGLHDNKPPVIPFPCQLHVITLSSPEELAKKNAVGILCNNLGISPMDVIRPSGPLTMDSVVKLFKQFAERYFIPYYGNLVCGQLVSKVSLSPSPLMHTSNCSIATTHNNVYAKLAGLSGKFPNDLVVCGFLDICNTHAPPVLSKHLVLDEEPVPAPDPDGGYEITAKTPKQRKLENGTADNDESKRPSFRVLFHGSLKINNLMALIQLGKEWFGLLGSESCQGGRKSNLVLSVLHPEVDVPWFGKLSHLGLMPQTMDPRSSGSVGFPVSLPHRLSYQTPANLSWVSNNALQNDIAKVIRYSTKLPDKESSFIKEVNKLRMCALTFGFQELLDLLCNVFSVEKSSAANIHAARMLDYTIHFLRTNMDPHQKLIPPQEL